MFKIRSGQLASQNSIESVAVSALPAIGDYRTESNPMLGRFPSLDRLKNTSLYVHLERRIGARVNLRQLGSTVSNRLRVSVDSGDRQVVVSPIDLSLKDICVESEQEIAKHGEKVEVTLSYEGISVVLPAIAVRQNSFFMQTAFLFVEGEGKDESEVDIDLDLIYHSLVAKAHQVRYGRFACFMLSAACSMLLVSWIFF